MLPLIIVFLLLRLIRPTFADGDWQLLWSEEFDGDTLDGTFWNTQTGFLGYNSEFQTYTDRPENVRVQDGKLHISAVRDHTAQVGYTSGRINTMDKVQVKYVTVEASIKIPDMKLGLWPAFWTLGQNYDEVGWPAAGELDIMEIGEKTGTARGWGNHRVISALHWDALGEYLYEDALLDVPYDLSQDFHVYKMEWTPNYLTTYVDNRQIGRFSIGSCFTIWDCPELHQYHFLVLNVAVAGQFTCCELGFELNAFPNGTAWTMEVDYVRVYGNEDSEIILPDGMALQPTPSPKPSTNYVTLSPISSSNAGNPAPPTALPTSANTAAATVMTTTTSPSSEPPITGSPSTGTTTTTLSPTSTPQASTSSPSGITTSDPIIATTMSPTSAATISSTVPGTAMDSATNAPTTPPMTTESPVVQQTASPTGPSTDAHTTPQATTTSPPTVSPSSSTTTTITTTAAPTLSIRTAQPTLSNTPPTTVSTLEMLQDLLLQDYEADTFTTEGPSVTLAPSVILDTETTTSSPTELAAPSSATTNSPRTVDDEEVDATEEDVSNANTGTGDGGDDETTTTSQIQSSGFSSWSCRLPSALVASGVIAAHLLWSYS